MNHVDKIITSSIKLIRNVCSVLLALMLLITSAHVFFRYVMNNPLIWSEETSLILLIWFGFFAVSNELYHGNHMAITMFYDKFPTKIKRAVDLVRHFIVAAFCVVMTIYLVKITASIGGNRLPVSGMPKIFLYIPVIISSVLMLFYSIVLFIKSLRDNYIMEGKVD